ncbi:MAG: hypothetical protein P9L92_20145 [Candidatus Electryonea clarkiae]|nr:hypothetical protein [Candidatus Electryonea clarkiae]MDP8285074.1 hypothetical protein [Candidatus Electryonea clarkiae]
MKTEFFVPSFFIFLVIVVIIGGCGNNSPASNQDSYIYSTEDYFPLEVGNTWIFESYHNEVFQSTVNEIITSLDTLSSYEAYKTIFTTIRNSEDTSSTVIYYAFKGDTLLWYSDYYNEWVMSSNLYNISEFQAGDTMHSSVTDDSMQINLQTVMGKNATVEVMGQNYYYCLWIRSEYTDNEPLNMDYYYETYDYYYSPGIGEVLRRWYRMDVIDGDSTIMLGERKLKSFEVY